MNKTSFVYGVIVAIAVFCLGAISAQSQNVYCVRSGATGSGNGLDWTNAYPSLPATLQRGATYYVAGGQYPSYTFNTPESGTNWVIVRKASPTNHGTGTGWVASYGTSQAVFATLINIVTGHFVLDGGYRNENDWFDGASYGFEITNNGAWTQLNIANGSTFVSNVSITNLYIAAIVGQLPSDSSIQPYAITTQTYDNTVFNTNYIFSRVFVEGSSNPFFIRQTTGALIEYCASENTCGNSTFHSESVNCFYLYTAGPTIRYSHFRHVCDGNSGYPAGGGTGVIAIANVGGMAIYGNIFESYYVGDGAVDAGWANNNVLVYNNTFVNGAAVSGPCIHFPVAGESESGCVAYNNLAVNCNSKSNDGQGTFGYNGTDTNSVFVNYTAGNYALARDTTIVGTNLPSPYNVDMAGNIRGAGGVWDLGTYQYVSGGTSTLLPPTGLRVVSF